MIFNQLGPTILLVDDDEAFQDVMLPLLHSEGFEVLSAYCATDAMELLTSRGSDVKLILLDLNMPGTGGLEFAKTIRDGGSEIQKKIPIVVTSATGRTSDMDAASAFDGFLQKPFELEKLIEICHRFCD